MSKRAVVLAIALSLATLAAAPDARAASLAPYSIIRTLQVLQEQVAHGNAAAQAAQPRLMAHIADEFLAADPRVWKEPRNAHAAVTFLFSGGKPAVVRAILDKGTMPAGVDTLIKGALAYGEGNDELARQTLGGIDPRSLPPMLGGHLALVQASLLPAADNAKAGKLLDLARLLVPGTLVEEAALRRQLFLLSGPENLDKFIFLARQYSRRYRTSIYADNFKQRLDAVARGLARAGDVAALGRFDAVLAEYPTAEQIGFYLAMAKTAIVEGKAVAARYAAEKASALAGGRGQDSLRSNLYAAAALVVSDDAGKGLKALQAIDRSKLSPEDAELQDAALTVATGVRAEPTAGASPPPMRPGVSAGPAPDNQSVAVLDEAQAAVAGADKLLQDKAQ